MKFILTVLLGCCIYLVSPAQADNPNINKTDTAISLENDSSNPEEITAFRTPIPRRLSDDSVKALKSMKEFVYMKNIDSFFRHRKIPKEAVVKTKTGNSKTLLTNPGLRTLYWLIAFLLLIIIIWKMFIGKNSLFASNSKLVSSHAKKEKTGLKPLTNEEQALGAIAAGNFRLAVRHLYIDTLEMLGQKGYLVITPQKTNYQYVRELNNEGLQKSFARLTLNYEYTWFGEFQLNQQQFNVIYKAFQNFKTSLL
jgi:hypothetical protein